MKYNSINLVVIVTNYNNSELSLKFYESALRVVPAVYASFSHFVIVDNNSDESEKEILRSYNNIGSVELIRIYSDKNLGYFKGLNLGIDYIINHKVGFHSIIVGNNDMCFDDNFLREFDNILMITEDFPVICPNLVDLDNVQQNPHVLKSISIFRRIVYSIYYRSYFLSRIILFFVSTLKLNRKIPHNQGSAIVLEGYGACYILGPMFFKYYLNLFAPFFLMFEESALTFQLKNIGYQPYYCSSLNIQHFEHSTFKRLSTKFSWECGSDSYKLLSKISNDFRFFQSGDRRYI
jgi:GT2 family glycosyltransferase